MKRLLVATAIVGMVGAVAALPAAAQQNSGTGTGFRMPYQTGFWGYVGAGGGVSDFRNCPGAGCDRRDQTYKIFGGGKFNETFGGEISYNDFGNTSFAGGNADAKGLNFSVNAGVPLGANSSIFGKLGTVYTTTHVNGLPTSGTERDWGLSYGVGGAVGLTPNWQLRLDWDRYRVAYVGRDDHIDALTLGVQYKFR